MPSDEPRYNGGNLAEAAAARKYDLTVRADSTGFYDATHENGRKVQVKAARHTRQSGEPGVFRVWQEHLEKLREHRGSVVVVVVSPSNPERKVLKVGKVSPRDLLNREFRKTGQSAMAGMHEARVPWPEVL